jgi:hypothetical protein
MHRGRSSAPPRTAGPIARPVQRAASADSANATARPPRTGLIATTRTRSLARSNVSNAKRSPVLNTLQVYWDAVKAGRVAWYALGKSLTWGVLVPVPEPDSDDPQRRENAAEEIHDRHN